MTTWIAEPRPAHLDPVKQAFFEAVPTGTVDLRPAGTLLPGDWWRLEEEGAVVGYGWMDVNWGDAQVLLAVHPAHQRRGHGGRILDHLATEAKAQGLRYLFNTIPAGHPDPAAARAFLEAHGFAASGLDGQLLRRAVG